MPQVPAIVAQHREVAVAAQAAGDPNAANVAYSMELQALAETTREPADSVSATTLAPLSAEHVEIVLGNLAVIEPEGAAALRRDWRGGDMAQNLAYNDWIVDRYGDGTETDTDMGLLQYGLAMAERIHAELRPGKVMEPLPRETVEEWLGEWSADERETIRRWQGPALATNLALASWMLQAGGGISPDSETSLVRLGAAIGRAVEFELRSAKQQPTAVEENTMGMTDEDEDTLEDLRAKMVEAQGRGDSRRANRLFAKEQEFIAERGGGLPIVGRGGRRA